MKKRVGFSIAAVLFCIIFFIYNNVLEFVYVNPNVYTDTFPYIAKSIKEIDKAIDYAVGSARKNGSDIKIEFLNAYGSGFIKGNDIPNDLDYSVGVNLGQFNYDGKNALQIGEEIITRVNNFEEALYFYTNTSNNVFYGNLGTFKIFEMQADMKNKNSASIAASIPKVFEDRDYIYYTDKSYTDSEKEMHINFPFILKSHEILLEDSPPVALYTNIIKYSKNMSKYQRKLTIVADYSFDIKNTLAGQEKNVELVAESFTGQRLQMSRRFFVPNVFIGENSAKFLSKLYYLNDDDYYLYYRLFNFKRHLQEFENINILDGSVVKMLKRISQCTDLIGPVLDDKTKGDIYKTVSETLADRDVQLLNEYTNALENLLGITKTPNMFFTMLDTGEIDNIYNVLVDTSTELRIRGIVDKTAVKNIDDFSINHVRNVFKVKNALDLQNFQFDILNNYLKLSENVKIGYASVIKDPKKINEMAERITNVYKNAGYHRVDMYWLDKYNIGVLKDNFTSKIPEKDLKSIAIKNSLADVNYRFIDEADIPHLKVRYSLWLKYNPTPDEDAAYNKLKNALLEDKKNFNIKRRFVLVF